MKTRGQKLLTNASPAILLIVITILSFPGFSFATMPKPGPVGKPERIQPQKLQNLMSALLQKAYSQRKVISDWHRKARLAAAKAEANKRKERSRALTAASKRACQIQLAMARSPADITIPGCRPNARSR